MTKKYMTCYYPGSFVSEDHTTEVPHDQTLPPKESRCFAFEFFEREIAIVDGEELLGKPKNRTKRTYIGTLYTPEDAINHPECNSIMRSNILGNKPKAVIRTIHGRWHDSYDDVQVIESL